jgi:hypothetical protein
MFRRIHRAALDESMCCCSRVPTHLLVLELDESVVVLDDLVAQVLARGEQLGEAKPLSGHLVAVYAILSGCLPSA